MKKYGKYILFIFLFSFVIMLPNMFGGYIKGHDTNFHVANISAIVSRLSFLNPFVKEPLPFIANNFGYGTRLFYPPIPHLTAAYITKFLGLFGMNSVVFGMRITQGLTLFLSGITMFFLGLKLFKHKNVAFLSACFYIAAPYHLSEIFIRDAFSEMFVPIAIPLILLGLFHLLDDEVKEFYACFVFGYVLLIYSHLAMAIYFTLMIVATFFLIYFKKIFTKKNIGRFFIASIFILGFTAPFWLPLLEIKLFGHYGIFIPYYITGKGDLRFSALNIDSYFNFRLDYDFIRYHLPVFITIFFFISVYFFFRKKKYKDKAWLFSLIFTVLAIVMTTKIFPWYYTPDLLQTLQFPWRLCLYVAFGVILVVCFGLTTLEHNTYFKKLCVLCFILSLLGGFLYNNHLNESVVDLQNIDYNKGTGNQDEYLPERVIRNRDYYENRSDDILVLNGSGSIHIMENHTPELIFHVDTDDTVTLELPRLYYSGYQLIKDNQAYDLKESEMGFLQVDHISSGTYSLKYVGTNFMKLAYVLCGITVFAYLCFYIFMKRKQ